MEDASNTSNRSPAERQGVLRRTVASLVFAAGAALMAGLSVAPVFKQHRGDEDAALPILSTLPAFKLIDQSGRPFSSADLRGDAWVADFFFTSCPGPCLVMSQHLRELRAQLPGGMRCVSITIDPETDQPAVLTRYAARFGIEPQDESWVFLTGTQEAIYRLAREGFHLAAAGPAKIDPADRETSLAEFLHSTRFALVDKEGRLRGYYESTDASELTRLRMDVARLR